MLGSAVYLFSIVAANLSITWFGPASAPVNAFLFIGLDLTLRDQLHSRWCGKQLPMKMGLLIFAGSTISAMLNFSALPISIASCVAFAGAGVADSIVYTVLSRKSPAKRVNGSNVAAACADSILFITIAFGWLPGVILLQIFAKALGGFVWYMLLCRTFTSRSEMHSAPLPKSVRT